MAEERLTKKEQVKSILERKFPKRFVYAPNYWQWFAHHRNHGTLPKEVCDCRSQIDLIKYLGLDIFSRNIYCNEQEYWFGGLADFEWDGVEVSVKEWYENHDKIIEKIYNTKKGMLTERLKYDFAQSTLIQEKFLIDDYANQLDILEELLQSKYYRFNSAKYSEVEGKVGDGGVAMAGELYSPLKMLHLSLGPVETVYLLNDYPERAEELMSIHEKSQLGLVQQMAESGVPAVISMDNLDTMFHPPKYVEKYCASFYEKASVICHKHNSAFFIHACGQQRDNLKLISSLGVDGLEGVAFPTLGDVELDEAMKIAGDRFLITGGISPIETRELDTREKVFEYVKELFERMKPYANRFMLSASCNTAINTSWDTIKHFRDAWMEYKEI